VAIRKQGIALRGRMHRIRVEPVNVEPVCPNRDRLGIDAAKPRETARDCQPRQLPVIFGVIFNVNQSRGCATIFQ
jgi:hypothetical protein